MSVSSKEPKGRTIRVNITSKDLDSALGSSALLERALRRNRYYGVGINAEGIISGYTRAGVTFTGKPNAAARAKLARFNATRASNRVRFTPFSFELTVFATANPAI